MEVKGMKIKQKKRIMVLVFVLSFVATMFSIETVVQANDMSSASELQLGEQLTAISVSGEEWYKIFIPKDIRDQQIVISVVKNTNTKTITYMDLYYSTGIQQNRNRPSLWSNDVSMQFMEKIQANDAGYGTLAKGQTYYLRIYGPSNNSYDIKVTGDYNKATKLSATTRKGNKYILVDTIKDAKVDIKINDKIIKTGNKKVTKISKSSGDGEIKINLSRKLAKGDKVTITVKKDGYETKKITKKIV